MRRLKISILFLITIIISGCSLDTPKTQQPLKSDKSLPTVQRIQVIPDTTAVAFEWLPDEHSNVAGYNLYRAEIQRGEEPTKLKLVAVIKNRISSHYVDEGLKPNTEYKYRFTLFTFDRKESKGSKAVRVKTIKPIAPLHYIIPIGNLANMAKLIWRPHTDPRVAGYVIERNELYNHEWKVVGELKHRLNVEFIDKGLKTNKVYRYRVRAKSFDGLLSKPSKIVDIRTKALPKPVKDIVVSNNLPKEIQLNWKPNEEDDVVKYRIYRSDNNNEDFEVIDEVKSSHYSDKITTDGQQMFYKISAVDSSGLESLLNEIPVMGTTLMKPKPPKLIELKLTQQGIFLRWEPLDPRSLKYKIIKRSGNGWLKGEPTYINVERTKYLDRDVKSGMTYSYKIVAIDKHEIESLPTEESEITVPK